MNKQEYRKNREQSLGSFSVLSDYELLELCEWFDAKDLLVLSVVSRFFHVFAFDESLWKPLCVRRHVKDKIGNFIFKGSWRRTFFFPGEKDYPGQPFDRLIIPGFSFSKLYHRYYRANIDLKNFWLNKCGIDKRENLSWEEFINEYESKNKPVIIRGLLDSWPAKDEWTRRNLCLKFGNRLIKTNGTDSQGRSFKMTFEKYFEYCRTTKDDKPIYLFDNKVFDKDRIPELAAHYQVPKLFQEDLFDLMKPKDRPDYRWMLVGPPRSGSPFHQDPHRTSAWNALICGRKRWALYPPDVIPPGVDEDLIDSEFYAAPEVMRWYIEHYPFLKPHQMPIEGIQEPGETIFVPSGWWHTVLNLEETIAVTQNFCSPRTFDMGWHDLIVRGTNTLRKQFRECVEPKHPELFAKFEAKFPNVKPKEDSSDSDSD